MSSGGQQAGFMELNPVQMGQNWGMHHTGEPQCSLFSVEPQNVSPGQAGLNGLDTGGRNAHHPGTVLAAEDMMSSEMEEWCGLAQQQQHLHQQQYQPQLQQQQQQLHQHQHHQHQHQHQHDQFLDSNMSYSSPVSSLLSPGGSSVGARAGSGGMNSRLLSMRQQMNAPPLNVIVPPMSGFSNTNLNIMSPGLLSGEMLNAAGSSAVNRMMTEGSIVRELFSSRQGQGHQLSTTPPPPLPHTSSYPMFNSPAAASAAIDRVLSRASSWVTPSSMGMDSRDPLQSVVPGVRLATSHCLAQFSSDPGFAERAARFSSFSNGSNNNCSPGSEAAARLQSRSSRGGAAAPMKTTAASPGVEGSKLWRTSSCPPLGNDAPSASAGAAGGADDFKHPASNCDAATNSSGSNAPACVDADQRSPSASTGVTESQYQRQQQQQAAAAASEKRKNGGAASPLARNGSGTGGKRLARTSSCPSAVAKLALEAAAVPKIEPGLEQQGNAPEDSSSSEQGDREEGSSDSQGKKRKTGGHDENATSKIPETSPASTTKSSKSGDNEESMVENPKRSRGGDKDPKTDRSCSDSGDSTSPRSVKEPAKPPEVPKPDYIHVRARRGQATDSHSLAERVRREKISERMKFLQDLVPGCSKVTGKAVMLDEIINYVQSLQRQVEFLSVKLASVNPRMDFNMDPIMTKEMLHHQSRGLPHQQQMIMGPDTMTMSSPFAGHLIHHQQQQQQQQQLLLPMQMAIGSCGMQMQQMTGACGMQQQQQMVPHMGGLSASMMEGLSAPMSPSCLDATSYGDTVSHVNAAQQHSYAAASLGQQGHQWNANWLCSEVDGVDPFAVCVP